MLTMLKPPWRNIKQVMNVLLEHRETRVYWVLSVSLGVGVVDWDGSRFGCAYVELRVEF